VSCFDSYITINSDTPSRSGLYASDLPGIDTNLLDGIARSITDDHDDIWATIYKRAKNNLISDISMNLQKKFFVDAKIISRETSSYQSAYNTGSSLAGVTLEFTLPRYAKLHIISVGAYSQSSYASGAVVKIYDTDENGELLATVAQAITTGRNVMNVDTDFEADKVFVSYNPATYSFKKTENKSYRTPYNFFDSVTCDFNFSNDYHGSVVQIHNGGLDVKYLVYCSAEKFVCENIKLFESALLYKIGYEITVERRLGERINEFTILSKERWDELESFYRKQYEQDLMNSIKSQNIHEDEVCFACKNVVNYDYQIP
jgi:hypothetical protein